MLGAKNSAMDQYGNSYHLKDGNVYMEKSFYKSKYDTSKGWLPVDGNSVIIRDPQNNTIIDLSDYMRRAKTFYYFRTDNLEPTEKVTRFIKNRQNKEGD